MILVSMVDPQARPGRQVEDGSIGREAGTCSSAAADHRIESSVFALQQQFRLEQKGAGGDNQLSLSQS